MNDKLQGYNKEPLLSEAEKRSLESSELVDSASSQIRSPKILFMRGISTAHSRAERCKQLIFSIFNIANAALGAGILAFPYAFYLGGYGVGLLLTFFSAMSNAYSLTIILYCARKFDVGSYQAVVKKMFGNGARTGLLVAIMFFTFFCNISYMIVISSMSSKFMKSWGVAALASNEYILPTLVWLLVLPLAFIKDLSFLGPFSIVGVLAIAFVVLIMLVHVVMNDQEQAGAGTFQAFNFRPCAFEVLPITMFGMFCHLTSVPACSQLQEYWPSLNSTGKTRYKTLVVIAISVCALCFSMYLPAGLVGYKLFGAGVQPDVLTSFGRNATSGLPTVGYSEGADIKIARLCMTLTTALGYPVQTFIARLAFWDVVGEKKFLSLPYILFTICFSASTLVLALVLVYLKLDIDFVMSVTSATAGVTIQFLFPSFMLVKIGSKVKGYIGIFLSVLMAVLSLFVSAANAICKVEFPTGTGGDHPLTVTNTFTDFCRGMGLLEDTSASNFGHNTTFF